MISMEKREVMQNKFKEKFRRRKAWTIDWSTPPVYPADAVIGKTVGDPVAGSGVSNASKFHESEKKEAD